MINYNNDDVEIIMKQTNYTYNQACEKLSEHDFDKLKVIREYLGILPKTEKNTPIKSINQEIYKQIRTELDTVMSNYNKKNPLNIEHAINNLNLSEEKSNKSIKK
jgi:acetyl-CoA carboxylase carboxyltransferase component